MRPWPDAIERLLADVEETPSGCLLFASHQKRPDGYRRIGHGGRYYMAHRFAYEVFVGPIPDGLELDHLCRNRNCVNPAHLEPVTHRENTLRSDSLSARHARASACPQGHAYAGHNLLILPDGRRDCRECKNRRNRELRQRKKRAARFPEEFEQAA